MHEITLVSPFPAGEGGRGDRGQESKLKAGQAGGKKGKPPRHLLDLPRGRGPSQTPKFLSPGPPSPWLPALLIGNRFLSVLRQTMGSTPGMQGAKPLA